MGSGLILLVIVAAWLAVLVPMALRSHESGDSLSSVERFSDAMRVLSRRDAAARARARAVAGPARLGSDLGSDLDDDLDDDLEDDLDDLGWDDDPDAELDDDDLDSWDAGQGPVARFRQAAGNALGSVTRRTRQTRRSRRPLTPARRRSRLLGALVALSVVTLGAGLLLWPLVLVAHGVADLLLVLFVVHLRRMALRRPGRRRQAAPRPARPLPQPRREVAAAPVEDDLQPPVEEAEVPQSLEVAQPLEVPEPVVATVARHDEPLPASLGLGAPWSPVPVPPPIYANAPMAPRFPRTVDLTRPGAYTEQAAGERLPGMDDGAPDTTPAAERRRAVNDW